MLEQFSTNFRPLRLHIIHAPTLLMEDIMVRIHECAASGVLLVIPEDSHIWRNELEARKLPRVAEPKEFKRALKGRPRFLMRGVEGL